MTDYKQIAKEFTQAVHHSFQKDEFTPIQDWRVDLLKYNLTDDEMFLYELAMLKAINDLEKLMNTD
jgi:hypothetical protein